MKMMSVKTAAVAALLILGAHGEMTMSTSTQRSLLKLQETQHKHKQNLKHIMSKMTTAQAMEKFQKQANQSTAALIQHALAEQQATKQRKKSAGGGNHLRASADPGYSGVDKAKNMLNEMIQETQAKYDLEIQTCCDYDQTQSGLIEQARQDISNFNAEAAEARKEVLDAQDHIGICQVKLPELNDALTIHNRECKKEEDALRENLAIINEDLKVMSQIMGMIDCNKKTSLMLMSCEDECTGESFVSFKDDDMHNVVDTLRLEESQRLLKDSLNEALSQDPAANLTTTWGPPIIPATMKIRSGPCKTPVPEDKRSGKCSIDGSPSCEPLQERFAYIQSGLEDKKDEVQGQLDSLLASCKLTRLNLEAQISDFETQLQDQLTALAAATKKQNTAEEQSRLKSTELTGFLSDYDGMTTRCHGNYETLEGEECGLKKIRGELYKMKGQDHPAFFQDCVVSDWLAGDCSVSCGGGTMRLSRTIVTAPVGGAACPVVEEMKSCNEDKCPIDCKVGDWEGWSSCTAKCGGGLMERARDTLVQPEHGGLPCEETTEAKSCNVQSCDQNCELSDWTAWAPCSKACNGGAMSRQKTIVTPLQGAGTCPDMRDALRMQSQSCNVFPCKNELLKFKFFKFQPTKLRSSRRANSVQVADFSFQNYQGSLVMNGWKATNPGGRSPGGQEASKGIDQNVGTKWLDFNKNKPYIMEATEAVEVKDFRFYTANDATERDPVGWKLWGSQDQSKWELLQDISSGAGVPYQRMSGTPWYPLPTMPLRCASPVDVVLVLDGSGSLRKKGWDATVKAAEIIVDSFMGTNSVQMAILLFSRKSEWVQHFSNDRKKSLENIKAMKWPRSYTYTSTALNTAGAELSLGRADSQSIVVVVTDGKPMSVTKTEAAAKKLKKSARLMWVPVTRYAPLKSIKKMASYPKEDNIVVIKEFADLEKPETSDRIISDCCGVLV